jgi:hypothetical protein
MAAGTTTGRRCEVWSVVKASRWLSVTERSEEETMERVVMRASWLMVTVNTDEWGGYNGLPGMGRTLPRVCHADQKWVSDDDGDGVREVRVNTLEGPWTRLRDFLRLFRGVSKKYLYQYVAFSSGVTTQRGRRRNSRGLSSV